MSDVIDELARALVAQERAEERLAKAAHALAEAEEQAEDDPDGAAVVEERAKLHATAEPPWGSPAPVAGNSRRSSSRPR